MNTFSCTSPLDFFALVEYWLAELAPADEEQVEEHLLGCAKCSERLRGLADLAEGIGTLVRNGVVRGVVTSGFLDRVAKEGLRVREYRVLPGGSVQCTVTAEDDMLVARLVAEFLGVSRVDIAVCDGAGREQERLRDVPVNPSTKELVFLQRVKSVRALPAYVKCLKLLAVEPQRERLLGEYTFIHTPTQT